MRQRPIVTVGEIEGFSKSAGMIEFVIDRHHSRVNMHIDLEAVQGAKLQLSSSLLKLKIVNIVQPASDSDACASCGPGQQLARRASGAPR